MCKYNVILSQSQKCVYNMILEHGKVVWYKNDNKVFLHKKKTEVTLSIFKNLIFANILIKRAVICPNHEIYLYTINQNIDKYINILTY